MDSSVFYKKLQKYFKNPFQIWIWFGANGFLNWISDEKYIKIAFWSLMHKRLHIDKPITFNEKIQWLKLYDRRPVYTQMVDKYEVKSYVSSIIGNEYIIPSLGIYERFDDIDFDSLPNQFVLKCTHDSGGIIICKDKTKFDRKIAKRKIEKSLRRNFYWCYREWQYKDVRPRILVEQYCEDKVDGELRDYKFYCFNGKPLCMLLATNRLKAEEELCFDYFDMDFNHLKLVNHWHPNAKSIPHKPKRFEEMKMIAAKLSCDIPQVRIDFYEANGQVLFGEFTFCDMGGFLRIHPENWEKEWGEYVVLPRSKCSI